jgi:hypothetical protein
MSALKPLIDHVVAGLVSVAVMYTTGDHTVTALVAAFMVGAGMSAKPTDLISKNV